MLSMSPNGELAVLVNARYLHHRFFDGTLATMPPVGGAPRERLEIVSQAAWAPDGVGMAILRDVNGKFRLEFPAGKVLYETAGWLSNPRFSPDGNRIAFFEHAIRIDDRGALAVVDLTGRKTTLSDGYWSTAGTPTWSKDGREIFFSAAADRSESIYAVTLDGRRRLALETPGHATLNDIAADGRFLITRDDVGKAIYGVAPGEKEERNFSWLDFSSSVLLSGNGQILVFTEENAMLGLNYTVCVRKTSGSEVTRLGEGDSQDLSADGKWVVAIVPSTPPHIALYPTGAGDARTLERGNVESYQSARWFPDEKRLLLCGNEPGQATRCYVQDISGGLPKAVTPSRTSNGIVAPDGQRILAQDSGGSYQLYPLDGSAPQPAGALAADERVIRWAPDGRSLFVFRANRVPTRVERVDLASGRRELFKVLAPVDPAGVLAVQSVTLSSDGAAYAYQYRRELTTLFVVEGAQ
jgi:Tol biopolymer transport system component